MYIVGSVALGEFRKRKSDVDAVWILADDPSPDDIQSLTDLHAKIAAHAPPHLDGVYVTHRRLATPSEDHLPTPFVVEGQFKSGAACGDLCPVLRQCLVELGITIFGPPPEALDVPADRTVTAAWIRENLEGYWRRWLGDAKRAMDARRPEYDLSAATLSWGALGVSRMAATLETGEIVGKTAGGEWAMMRWPEWAPALLLALDERAGYVEQASRLQWRVTIGYIDFLISRYTRA
jgi:hypothetical protein